MKAVEIKLRDGSVCHGDKFDLEDYKKLQKIFDDWQNINKQERKAFQKNA